MPVNWDCVRDAPIYGALKRPIGGSALHQVSIDLGYPHRDSQSVSSLGKSKSLSSENIS